VRPSLGAQVADTTIVTGASLGIACTVSHPLSGSLLPHRAQRVCSPRLHDTASHSTVANLAPRLVGR